MDIEYYLSNYILTIEGNVINKNSKRILKTHLRNGYPSVNLSHKNCKKTYSIHQLMVFYFWDIKSSRKLVVNHIDGNRTNNHLNNLEVITQKLNVEKAFLNNQRQVHTKGVIQYSLQMEKIKEFSSIREAEKETGICDRMISRVCKKQRNQTGEYLHNTQFNLDKYRQIQKFSHYWINSDGNIYSDKLKRLMMPYLNKNGYLKIKLCNNGYQKDFYLHQLVAYHFLPPPEYLEKNQVNQKNGNRQNNCVENLEWVSCSENVKHSHEFLRN